MDKLTKELEASRGKTVEVGAAAKQMGTDTEGAGTKADKAGDKAAKAAERARLAFHKWAQEANETQYKIKRLADDAMWDRIHDRFRLLNLTLKQSVDDAIFMIKLYAGTLVEVKSGLDDIAKDLPVVDLTAKAPAIPTEYINGLLKQVTPIRDAISGIFADLPNVIIQALSSGQSLIAGVAQSIGATFGEAFRKGVERQAAGGKAVTTGEKMMGTVGIGVESFFGGYGIGQATKSKTKGALGGAASGALAGLPLAGATMGISVAVGAVAGLFGGLMGASKAQKQMRAELEANKKALAAQYGGMEQLNKLALKLGVNIKAAFDAKKPEQFQAAVDKLNKAIEEQKKRMEGLNSAVDGVNKRTAIFAKQFEEAFKAGDTAKLAEIAQRAQPEFERLGLMVRDTFAGLIKETGSAYDAMMLMERAFKVLQQGVDDFGLTSTAAIDELLANFRLVNDEGLKPLFENIAASGQVLRGLFDAKALSPEGFQAIAADIGQSIQEIVNRGGDMQRTLALSQPVLQTLWEAQQQYGKVTDQTTQSILNQAEQQGLVGAHMKDVNKQILDVLLGIGKVLGADIPTYFDKLKQPAEDAAANIEQAFTDITIPPVQIPYVYVGENAPPGAGVTELASGGIVRRPTLAMIGEGGPEAVVPLTGGALGVGGSYITDVYLDGERIARSTAKRMPRVLRTMGVGM